MMGRWQITMFREPQDPPFDHPFSVVSPAGGKWIARTLRAAIRLVDEECFMAEHPELRNHSRA